jgi:hypothetical protein
MVYRQTAALALPATVLKRIGMPGQLEEEVTLLISLFVLWYSRLLVHSWHSSLNTLMVLLVYVEHTIACVQSHSQVAFLKLSGLQLRVRRLSQGLVLARVMIQTKYN